MERFSSPKEALESVHAFLYGNYWPAHVMIGDEFTIIADDLDDNDREIPLTIRVVSKDLVEIETTSQIPNEEPTCNEDLWVDQLYRSTIKRAEHPLAFRALVSMTMAFRIDSHVGCHTQQETLQRTRSPKLRAAYRILDHLPWLETLSGDFGTYTVPGDSSPWPKKAHNCKLEVLITPYNDTWLTIGYPSARIRHGFGGGHNPLTYSALYVLAEAIRLENEER